MVKKCLDAKNLYNVAVLEGCQKFHEGFEVVVAGYQPTYDKVISTGKISKLMAHYITSYTAVQC